MAEIMTLEAKSRAELGTSKSQEVRRAGLLPAVLYGKKKENLNLAVDADAFIRALKSHAHLFELKLPGGKAEAAVVKEMQINKLTDELLHVDFGRVDLDEEIEVKVGLKFVGDAKGVMSGGHLEVPMHQIMVRCTARHIPDEIRVDITDLGLDQVMRLADVKMPKGIKAAGELDLVVVACRPAKVVEETVAAAGPAEPEVVAKGKKDKEGEGEAEAK